MIRAPDLLHLEPRVAVDEDAVHALLELAFMGKEAAKGLDRQLGILDKIGYGWNLDLFAEDLFVRDLIQQCFTIAVGGVRFPVNQAFLFHVLSDPPTEREAIAFRQGILRELEGDATLEANAKTLYQELSQLLAMFKAPDHAAKLDANAYRLDIFKQARGVIDWMVDGFATARSGLRRLHDVGVELRRSEEYSLMADLLDYEQRLASLDVRLSVGADGDIKRLELLRLEENTANRYYSGPWKRFGQRILIALRGFKLSPREIVNRLLQQVFKQVGPTLVPLVQLIGQLEVYLSSLSFREQARARGLEVCLPSFERDRGVELEQVFNPLLLHQPLPPVPCSIATPHRSPTITIITGPNSGGKTRLLQTVGLVQLLGQSGLYVPAAEANLPKIRGLFVSLVENETADQAEGRLGRELMRIRSLFESMGSPSMVILDELCSGTNPSEGTEIFTMVLRLLDRLDTVAFISTHLLDFAKGLEDDPPVESLSFLRVESAEDLSSTYQFLPGVAKTSLAAATAERLGAGFEQLAELIEKRRRVS